MFLGLLGGGEAQDRECPRIKHQDHPCYPNPSFTDASILYAADGYTHEDEGGFLRTWWLNLVPGVV